jgi:hypothetical protein
VIDHQQHPLSGSVRSGTSVTVHWPESSWSELEDAGASFLPLVNRYHDLNPHLTLYATWVDEERRTYWFGEAIAPGWAKWTPSSPTSPHSYRPADLERLAGAFLSHDREHKAVRVLRDFIAQFDGLSGTTKRKAVLNAVGLQRAPLERLLNGGDDFDHALVERLLNAMKGEARPIRPKALGPLGRDAIADNFDCWGADLDTYRYKRIEGVDDGVPWIVEAAFAYAPDQAGRTLLFGVNWSPAIGTSDPFNIYYKLGAHYCGPTEPIVLLVHLICPRPEFLDRGKSRVASFSPGCDAIQDAVDHVIADWAKQRRSEIRNKSLEAKRLEKMRVENKTPELSLRELVLKYLPSAIRNVSNSGTISFTQRDLFYVIRPIVQSESDNKTFKYNYFKALLTDIENEQGEIKGLQREPRGSIYHPHTAETIPLSTESVASYQRPFWTFNKIIYIEKAGTQKNLIETGWPEEFDCAIATSGGFTTRAVKDLFDLLATSTEPVTVFCVHDADAAGTMIFHTLVNETKARGARKIEVVNLGLEPWQGINLGLEVEKVEGGTDRRRAVAPYVVEHDEKWRAWLNRRGVSSWDAWLQKHRIELNAMPPADRIAWLTRKIEQYPPRKVVPPAILLHAERVSAARAEIRDEIERRARIDERTDEALATVKWSAKAKLPKLVNRFLEREKYRDANWKRPMKIAGRKLAKRVLATIPDKSNGAGGEP